MMSVPFDLPNDDNNPLDMIEDVAASKGWKITEQAEDYIGLTVKGEKADYTVFVEWQDEFSALLFSCAMPIEMTEANYETAARTLERVNQNIWLGHFDLTYKGNMPTFRHTMLFRMIPSGIAIDIVQDLFEIAIAECNRFFSTFQLVQAGDVRVEDNLSAAVFETVGEA